MGKVFHSTYRTEDMNSVRFVYQNPFPISQYFFFLLPPPLSGHKLWLKICFRCGAHDPAPVHQSRPCPWPLELVQGWALDLVCLIKVNLKVLWGKKQSYSFPLGLNLKGCDFGPTRPFCHHKGRTWNS